MAFHPWFVCILKTRAIHSLLILLLKYFWCLKLNWNNTSSTNFPPTVSVRKSWAPLHYHSPLYYTFTLAFITPHLTFLLSVNLSTFLTIHTWRLDDRVFIHLGVIESNTISCRWEDTITSSKIELSKDYILLKFLYYAILWPSAVFQIPGADPTKTVEEYLVQNSCSSFLWSRRICYWFSVEVKENQFMRWLTEMKYQFSHMLGT